MTLIARFFTGPMMFAAGILHFVKPEMYIRIMPDELPAHRELVLASGVAEVAGATLSMIPATRRLGGLLMIATLLGVFPANVHMAVRAERFEKHVPGGRNALWARLPLQGVMLYLVYRATLKKPA
jgi:uncharacterized membrane protein